MGINRSCAGVTPIQQHLARRLHQALLEESAYINTPSFNAGCTGAGVGVVAGMLLSIVLDLAGLENWTALGLVITVLAGALLTVRADIMSKRAGGAQVIRRFSEHIGANLFENGLLLSVLLADAEQLTSGQRPPVRLPGAELLASKSPLSRPASAFRDLIDLLINRYEGLCRNLKLKSYPSPGRLPSQLFEEPPQKRLGRIAIVRALCSYMLEPGMLRRVYSNVYPENNRDFPRGV